MTLQDKVGMLVRYCSKHQSHGFMMDERNPDGQFNVHLPEEEYIKNNIENLNVILLTGEAGDGKSRIMRNLEKTLTEHGFTEPCRDFSALQKREKESLISQLKSVLRGESSKKLIIAANIGVFTQAVIQYSVNLMEELTKVRNDVYICNFESRNLAGNKKTFEEIIKNFLSYECECTNEKCIFCNNLSNEKKKNYCSYKENIEKLLSPAGMNAVRTICDAIYLTGGHITFRELLSLLAYTVTFGQSCQERIAEGKEVLAKELVGKYGNERLAEQDRIRERLLKQKLYYHVFDASDDILLRKVSRMDPGLERGKGTESGLKEDYRNSRREEFFREEQDSYGMLHVEYLKEFREVLKHINRPPYYFDTATDNNPVLQQIKKGINKMGNQEKSDTGLTVVDTPAIFDKKIRMEFLVAQDISMIWHRYDLQIGGTKPQEGVFWNKFCLGYQYKDKEGRRKLISLLIDYIQFRYLMLCSYDYFLNRDGLSQEEYAVNTFYRKILSVKEDAYDTVRVRFDDSLGKYSDFTLNIHSETDFWTEEEKQTILIGKGD